jgi:hypothetical protein
VSSDVVDFSVVLSEGVSSDVVDFSVVLSEGVSSDSSNSKSYNIS